MANKITTIGLPEKTWKKTKMYAAKNNMSMAGVIVQATEAFLGLTAEVPDPNKTNSEETKTIPIGRKSRSR